MSHSFTPLPKPTVVSNTPASLYSRSLKLIYEQGLLLLDPSIASIFFFLEIIDLILTEQPQSKYNTAIQYTLSQSQAVQTIGRVSGALLGQPHQLECLSTPGLRPNYPSGLAECWLTSVILTHAGTHITCFLPKLSGFSLDRDRTGPVRNYPLLTSRETEQGGSQVLGNTAG